MRGFLFGGLFGGVFSALGLSLASLLAPQPAGNTPPQPPQTSMIGTDAPAAEGAASADLGGGSDDAPQADPAVASVESMVDPAPRAETEPAAIPEAGAPPAPIVAPDIAPAEGAGAQLDPSGEAPVLPSPQGQALRQPVAENDLLISTDPAQPVTPVSEPSAFVPASDAGALSGEAAAPEAADPAQDAAPQSALPQSALPESALPVRRLAEETPGDAPEAARAADLPALERYATAFEADGRPRLSVIVIDTAPQMPGPALLSQLGVPVSVALRGSDPEAGARAAAYRAQGIELLLLSDLPDGATPPDAATALEAGFGLVPETVALLDAGPGGLGRDPAMIGTALSRLAEDGRGFISLSGGLNTAQRQAEREGIPAVEIYSDLNPDGQSATIMRRFLDQAAFRARQQGQIVVMLRLSPDALSALELWQAASRAQEVQIAPVSALLISD